MSARCPEGHASDEDDYCSVCGAAIDGKSAFAGSSSPAGAVAARAMKTTAGGGAKSFCPECGEPRDDPDARFCEVCRYDFVAKKPGPPPVVQRLGRQTGPVPTPTSSPRPPSSPPPPPPPSPPAPPPPQSKVPVVGTPVAAPAKGWELVLAVDPSLDVEPDPATPCPNDTPERVIPMDKPEILVGRHDDQRDIHPELPLHDPGASRRHAKFVIDADGGLALQDLASTNGTVLNGRELTAGTRRRLKLGDQITIGRWTRITVRGRS